MIPFIASLVALAFVLWAFREKDKGFALERREWAQERRELLLRIQAPEVAVVQQQMEKLPPSPPAVGFDDDAGYWESKEAMAERLMAEEISV